MYHYGEDLLLRIYCCVYCHHMHACSTHACTSTGMILINSENSLVRGLPYTSHLSPRSESGSTLIVWKWGCINDVNPWKISSGVAGAAGKQQQHKKKRVQWEGNGDARQAGRWLDGDTNSYRDPLSHCMDALVSPFHTFFFLFFCCLLWLSSPQRTFTCQHDRQ